MNGQPPPLSLLVLTGERLKVTIQKSIALAKVEQYEDIVTHFSCKRPERIQQTRYEIALGEVIADEIKVLLDGRPISFNRHLNNLPEWQEAWKWSAQLYAGEVRLDFEARANMREVAVRFERYRLTHVMNGVVVHAASPVVGHILEAIPLPHPTTKSPST